MLSFSNTDVLRYFGKRVTNAGEIPERFNGVRAHNIIHKKANTLAYQVAPGAVQALPLRARLLGTYSINWPPFTSTVSPTMKPAASEARNTITVAHSIAVPSLPSGMVATKLRSISGVEKAS